MTACPKCGRPTPTPAHEFLHDRLHNLPDTAYADINLLPVITYDKVAKLMTDFAARMPKEVPRDDNPLR